jgi:predicted nuclease of predicted toxin-antitoxin system
VRFLLDQNQSPLLAGLLRDAGHDAIHVRDIGLRHATDAEIMSRAKRERRVVLSVDTDFGELLASSGDHTPSVLLLRRHDRRRAHAVAELILINLDTITDDLDTGAIVVFDQERVRIRRLPI